MTKFINIYSIITVNIYELSIFEFELLEQIELILARAKLRKFFFGIINVSKHISNNISYQIISQNKIFNFLARANSINFKARVITLLIT